MAAERRGANRLANEKSPYLRQHSENPVDWYPWSSEAFERAKREDKPVIISIGYSSCHWCHVMEKESFEDPSTARIMNENFISIKVDREEYPDVDSLYMKAVQAMTGSGGWPLTVFATPRGVPFYGGTYFPPEDSHGLPSFKKVLSAAAESYGKNKDRIEVLAEDISRVLRRAIPGAVILSEDVLDGAFEEAQRYFDPVRGGFGSGAKFPQTMLQKFLLLHFKRTGRAQALNMVTKTLTEMARGGIYDHLGGGFHRYSVDESWDVPHFEKMLYDNALLMELYSLVYAETKETLCKKTVFETFEYLLRDLAGPSGGFYSSQDADTGGVEGAFYVWSSAEVRQLLGDEAEEFINYFSITEEGNFDGKNTLRVSAGLQIDREKLKSLKGLLLKERLKRPLPDIDRKIITGWNGLAVKALSAANGVFGEKRFMDEAKRCAEFILSELKDAQGRLRRYHLDGASNTMAGLEDYALLGEGLMELYDASKEKRWLAEAEALAKKAMELFYEKDTGLFYDTTKDAVGPVARERDLFDTDLPSGNSSVAGLFLKLSKTPGNGEYRTLAKKILSSCDGINTEPVYHGHFLSVLEELLGSEKTAFEDPPFRKTPV